MNSVYLLQAVSDECQAWMDTHIETEMSFAGGIPIETRYLGDILEGLPAEGFAYKADYVTEPPIV